MKKEVKEEPKEEWVIDKRTGEYKLKSEYRSSSFSEEKSEGSEEKKNNKKSWNPNEEISSGVVANKFQMFQQKQSPTITTPSSNNNNSPVPKKVSPLETGKKPGKSQDSSDEDPHPITKANSQEDLSKSGKSGKNAVGTNTER